LSAKVPSLATGTVLTGTAAPEGKTLNRSMRASLGCSLNALAATLPLTHLASSPVQLAVWGITGASEPASLVGPVGLVELVPQAATKRQARKANFLMVSTLPLRCRRGRKGSTSPRNPRHLCPSPSGCISRQRSMHEGLSAHWVAQSRVFSWWR